MKGVGFTPASWSAMIADFATGNTQTIIDDRISVISKEVQYDQMEANVIHIE
jgi:hypothetical protein